MRAFGVREEQIAPWLGEQEQEAVAFEVWPENWPALELFLALQTQWRHAGMAGLPTGLDYAAIEPALRLMGMAPSPQLFADLRVMEDAALVALHERWRRK